MGQSKTKAPALRAVPPAPAAPPAVIDLDASVTAPDSPLQAMVMLVTPELAKRWLEKNHPNNRPVAFKRVEAFANDMRANAWKLTHQPICFDGEGRLIDGQHRLEAVVMSGATVQMFVVHNAAGSYHDPIDRTGPRSVAVIVGLPHRDVACLNVLRMMETGYQLHTPMTVNEAEGLRERHLPALTVVATIPGRAKLTGPVLAAVCWALPCNRERTIDFAVKAAGGEMIGRGHPAFAFRSWRDRNPRTYAWETMQAATNCIRYHLNELTIAQVTIGDSGYRALCARRRALKIPNTPSPDVVPSVGFRPSPGRTEGGGE